MFDIGFSEVLLIFVIALVVLGPEKLPRLASQVGRWIGRARAMARQFREQLEEEVNLEEVRRAHEQKPKAPADAGSATSAAYTSASAGAAESMGTAAGAGDAGSSAAVANASENSPYPAYQSPDPTELRADTFSHAHPTNELGANPHTANGAAEPEPTPSEADVPAATNVGSAQSEPPETHERASASEAYASNTPAAPAAATREPTTRPATEQADTHGQS